MSRAKSSTEGRFKRRSVSIPTPGSGTSPLDTSVDGSRWDALPLDESDLSVDPAELRDFLAGDLVDVHADPIFKERLRQKLWRLVRVKYGGSSDED